MKIARLRDINLIYSSVAESTSPEYSSTTTYATGDVVKVSYESDGTTTHRPVVEYKSLADSNTGNYPPDNPDKWEELGATNRWKMFDGYVNTQTEDNKNIVVEIDSSNTNKVGLFDLQGTSVKLTQIVNSELITDGDCSTDSFVKETGWTYDSTNGEYDCDGTQTSTSRLYQSLSLTEGKKYIVKFTVKNYSAGSVAGLIGNVAGDYVSANGDYAQVITAGATGECGVIADADFVGSIDDVSVMRVASNETIGLDQSYTPDYWYYFFSDFSYRRDVSWEYPLYSNSKMRIEIATQGGVAKCGMVALGRAVKLGNTMYDIRAGISDYSKKETDSLGRTYLKQGNYAKRLELDFWLLNADIDIVSRALADVRGLPVIIDANEPGTDYGTLVIYGFVSDFSVIVPGPRVSKCSIELEGLI